MPSISIITPSYNQASYLEQAIRSVLAQDSSDLEYIVVDGGSTDRSLEIINRYADRLSWWVSEPDDGQGDAINKGLLRAKGDYVAWLNSDDLYLPGAVNAALDVLEANPNLGMVFADAITIDPSGKPLNRLTFGDWGLVELMSFRIICQPAVFMRRSVIEEAGYIDSSYHFMLDHQLWIRIARTSQIQHVKQSWAAARHHPSAKNVAQASAFSKEILRILEWMDKQSDLAPIFKSYNKQINAGAQRLNARYLLDGGQPKEALQAYWKALTLDPGYTIHHWHRMLYALLSILGAGDIANSYYRIASSGHNWQPLLEENPQLSNWPGITLISK
jgi:glycosyltransferase involved in cell wall biosynthesis